jgi:hypothetical protein
MLADGSANLPSLEFHGTDKALPHKTSPVMRALRLPGISFIP